MIALVATPFFVRLMGLEAFGLIGLSIALHGLLRPLEVGLNAVFSRELPLLYLTPEKMQDACGLFGNATWLCRIMGLLISVLFFASAPFIAEEWLEGNKLTQDVLSHAILLIGLGIGLRCLGLPCQGGLIGRQHQVSLAVVNAVMATVRLLGVLPVLYLISTDIRIFFAYQLVCIGIHTTILALLLRRTSPELIGSYPKFKLELLKPMKHFAAGVGGAALLTYALMYMDRLVVSKLITLEGFGRYCLAATVAGTLLALSMAVFTAILPRFSQLFYLKDFRELKALYHFVTQVMGVILWPAVLVISLFSQEILTLLLGNPEAASLEAPVMAILVIGAAVFGLNNLPYALQLAFGWTRLAVIGYSLTICIMIPTMILMTKYFGSLGAAISWTLPLLAQLVIIVPIMHRRIFPKIMWRWYAVDIMIPLGCATIVVGLAKVIWPISISPTATISLLGVVSIGAVLLSGLAAPEVRQWGTRLLWAVKSENR